MELHRMTAEDEQGAVPRKQQLGGASLVALCGSQQRCCIPQLCTAQPCASLEEHWVITVCSKQATGRLEVVVPRGGVRIS
jgi:hypothetical protein